MLAFATGKLQYNCVTLRLHFTKHVTQLTASSFVIVRFFRNSITMAIWNITKQLGVNVTLLMDIPVHYIADVERGEDGRHRYLSQPKPSVIFVLLHDTQFLTMVTLVVTVTLVLPTFASRPCESCPCRRACPSGPCGRASWSSGGQFNRNSFG